MKYLSDFDSSFRDPIALAPLNKGWAASKPKLKQVDSRYRFGMQPLLYKPQWLFWVEVCDKPK